MRALKISFAVLCAALVVSALVALPQRLCFDGGKNYTFYLGTSSADCREFISGESAAQDRLMLQSVCGESAEFENFDLDGFLSRYDAEIIFKEELSDSVNYYCSADLPYSVELYGQKINLHICVRRDCVKVASPIIFGGY